MLIGPSHIHSTFYFIEVILYLSIENIDELGQEKHNDVNRRTICFLSISTY